MTGSLAETELSEDPAACSIHENATGFFNFYNVSDLGKAVIMNSTTDEDIDHTLDNGCDVNYNGTILEYSLDYGYDDYGYDYYDYDDYGYYDYGYDDYSYDDYGGYDYGGYDYGGSTGFGYIYGITALHIAVLEGDKASVIKLCAVPGIELDMETSLGNTPLTEALIYNYTDIMEELVLAGANINHTDINNDTLLHLALIEHNLPAVELLVRHGVDLDAQSTRGSGMTALHIAVLINSTYVVELLLANGADTSIKDVSDFTARDYGDIMAELSLTKVFKDLFDSASE